jgi:putative transcriptional regulator
LTSKNENTQEKDHFGNWEEKIFKEIAGDIVSSTNAGSCLRKWREIFGIAQNEMAKIMGIAPSILSEYENGKVKNPGINYIRNFVEALKNYDKERDYQVAKRISNFQNFSEFMELHEFSAPITAEEFTKTIEGEIVANPYLMQNQIYGYTLVNSFKFLLEMPIEKYLMIYGYTPMRAIVFYPVEHGRSPLLAIHLTQFSVKMKPNLVVFHGLKKEKIDKIALKLANKLKIPVVVSSMELDEMRKKLEKFK